LGLNPIALDRAPLRYDGAANNTRPALSPDSVRANRRHGNRRDRQVDSRRMRSRSGCSSMIRIAWRQSNASNTGVGSSVCLMDAAPRARNQAWIVVTENFHPDAPSLIQPQQRVLSVLETKALPLKRRSGQKAVHYNVFVVQPDYCLRWTDVRRMAPRSRSVYVCN